MKRATALQNIRTICERLDQVDPVTFPIQPVKLYLFGSTLTDRPDPSDVDLGLLCQENRAWVQRIQSELEQQGRSQLEAIYNQTLSPTYQGRKLLRAGMRNVQIAVFHSFEAWTDLLMLDGDGDIRLIWRPGLDWRAVLADIAAHPRPWSGPRPPDAKAEKQAEIEALSLEERDALRARIVARLGAQE